MKRLKKIVFLILLLQINNQLSYAQSVDENKIDINNKIVFANQLISHINYNLYELDSYQESLMIWFENPNKKMESIPKFNFKVYSENRIIIKEKLENSILDYNSFLKELNQKTILFDNSCKRLLNLKSPNSEVFRKDIFLIIRNIKEQSLEVAEVSYNFSVACAMNSRSEKYPPRLENLRNIISESKSLILSIRDNNIQAARFYLKMLDKSLKNNTNSLNFDALSALSSTNNVDFSSLSQKIYKKAFNISAWGEQFLQSSFSDKGLNILLRNCIEEFNGTNNDSGCASIFNDYLETLDNRFMYFVEEPNTLFAEQIEDNSYFVEEKLTQNKSEPIKTTSITEKENEIRNNEEIIAVNKPEEKIEQVKIEVFNPKDNNSLSGSLPNNIIILLDVSVSMKKSEKLPILKRSIQHFLNIMREQDKISLIAYSGETKVLVSGGSKSSKAMILDTLSKVKSSGGSDIYNALEKAYEIGNQNFIPNGNNKIIIASDGIFGITFKALDYVSEITKKDFSLSIFQYSKPEEDNNIKSLKNLAEVGKGNYSVIYNTDESIATMMKEIKKQDHSN